MKSFAASAALVATATLPLLASGAPLATRDTVSCTKKYEGTLYLRNLSTLAGTPLDGATVGVDSSANRNLVLSTAKPIRFQFDECRTSGWNQDGREYGQVKAVEFGDHMCVTGTIGGDESNTAAHPLSIKPCSASNTGPLQQQWFYANYKSDTPSVGPYVTLQLRGDPNETPNQFDLPAATDLEGGRIAAETKTAGHKNSLNLFNVAVVS